MPTPSKTPPSATQAQPTSSTRPAILLVDDDPNVLRLLGAALPGLGFEPLAASSGPEAVEVLRRRGDARGALVDVRMPGMDGLQTLRALRELAPELPCLFMTGDAGDHHGTGRLLDAGAEGVLRKPFHLSDLAGSLRRLIG